MGREAKKGSAMPANPRCWVTCVDCGEREMVRRSALGRRTRLRCRACGGAVEPSDDARDDLAEGMDRRREEKLVETARPFQRRVRPSGTSGNR